ncbi:hypothetical protein AB0L22_21610 [Micromonospora haikouensis]|uniref:hypothetical protein n=1 Tax=Micromonospora haikouensis TaxID=686309 RepID=UPI0034200C11
MQLHEQFGRRFCVSVDAEGYGGRDDCAQHDMQRTLVQLLDAAAARAKLDRTTWLRQGVGDEELSLVPLGPDEPRMVDDFPRQLDAELARYNRSRDPAERLRLRMALHVGVAYRADNGFAGQGVVVVSRLLNAAPVRSALKLAPAVNLALIVSDVVFTDVIGQGHTTLVADDFRRVEVSEKEYRATAWLRVPGADVHRLDLGGAPDQPAGPTPEDARARPTGSGASRSGLVNNIFNNEVHADHATFGISGGVHG